MNKRGIIFKGIGGFYYVHIISDDGKSLKCEIYCCKARGILKKQGITPCVGDVVEVDVIDGKEGVIEKIEKRKNSFVRPPVSNVDVIVIVASASSPKANPYIIDKFMVVAKEHGVDVLLCINKIDEAEGEDIDKIKDIYKNVCPVILISGIARKGMDYLKRKLTGKKVAFAGPSGVGKSTIINALNPKLDLEIGSISKKNKRGKHTTRHVEIFQLNENTLIYDTPGFTSFDLIDIKSTSLKNYFTEIDKIGTECRFGDCMHINEPECRVIEALNSGQIHKSRYESYKMQLSEIMEKEKRKF